MSCVFMLVIDRDMLVLGSLIKRLLQQHCRKGSDSLIEHFLEGSAPLSPRKCPQEKDAGVQALSAHPHQPQPRNQKLLNYQRAPSRDDSVVIMGVVLANQALQPLARLVKPVLQLLLAACTKSASAAM